MKQLIKTLGDRIVGVSSGFDRLVFQGMIRPIMYPEGAMSFFSRRKIQYKDAKRWVIEQTERLVSAVEDWSQRECGEGITYLAQEPAHSGKTIVTILPDSGERYLSSVLFEGLFQET